MQVDKKSIEISFPIKCQYNMNLELLTPVGLSGNAWAPARRKRRKLSKLLNTDIGTYMYVFTRESTIYSGIKKSFCAVVLPTPTLQS